MKRDKRKVNDDRFDQDCELFIGPSSRPFNIAQAALSPYLTQQPAQLDFTHHLSTSSLSKLASRCSTRSIQSDVRRLLDDGKSTQALRERMLAWAESDGTDEPAERTRKKSRRGQSKEIGKEESIKEAFEEVDSKVPGIFRFTTQPRLSTYHRREGLLEQSCIKKTVPTHLLRMPRQEQITEEVDKDAPTEARSANKDETSPPLVLSISVYTRPVRGMWAKERVQQLAGVGMTSMHEAESDSSSASSKEMEDLKMRKGDRSLYGPLQLVQKVEILSDSTLQELRESFLCRMDDLPEKEGSQYSGRKRITDSCLLIEDQLYSEGLGEDEYAAILEKHLLAKASPAKMREVKMASLTLCTGKLYWFLHQGSCEHLWTITSMRARREEETLPTTSYYASAAAVHPLAKWTQTKNGGVRLAYSLDKCDLCKGNSATLLLAGGGRFQSTSPTVISGLKQDTTCICQACWSALRGKKAISVAESMQRAGGPHPSMSDSMASTGKLGTRENWTLMPVLE